MTREEKNASRLKGGINCIIGNKFERLTVLEFEGFLQKGNSAPNYYWICQCSCEAKTIKSIIEYSLTSNHTKSCGCIKNETTIDRNTKHNLCGTKIYRIWQNMKNRCYNPKNIEYHRYGGRGIKVCERWLESVENFSNDLGEIPSDNHSIERINNDGDYTPENCRWATSKEQANNKSNNVIITHNNESLNLMQWSEKLSVEYDMLRRRHGLGWTDEEIISTPIGITEKLVEYNGKTQNIKEWANEIGITEQSLGKRFLKGWSTERALTTKAKPSYDKNSKINVYSEQPPISDEQYLTSIFGDH